MLEEGVKLILTVSHIIGTSPRCPCPVLGVLQAGFLGATQRVGAAFHGSKAAPSKSVLEGCRALFVALMAMGSYAEATGGGWLEQPREQGWSLRRLSARQTTSCGCRCLER